MTDTVHPELDSGHWQTRRGPGTCPGRRMCALSVLHGMPGAVGAEKLFSFATIEACCAAIQQ